MDKALLLLKILFFLQQSRAFAKQKSNIKYYTYDKSKSYDPSKSMDELILSAGYNLEDHKVTTEDGYILTLYRIVSSKPIKEPKTVPILHNHGVFGSSASCCTSSKGNNFAYSLVDLGYDVWSSNIRGNAESLGHVTLDSCRHCKEYWNFTLDHVSRFDIPAFIDYILLHTNKDQLYYYGFSLATTELMMTLSEFPEYNNKIKRAIFNAPIAFFQHSKTFLTEIAENTEKKKSFLETGRFYVTGYDLKPLMHIVKLCRYDLKPFKMACAKAISYALHMVDEVDVNALPLHFSFFPGQEGYFLLDQMSQNMLRKENKFYKYDYGKENNVKIYGTIDNPAYDFSKVTAKCILIAGKGDGEADFEDVQSLANVLPNSEIHLIKVKGWGHGDDGFGIHSNQVTKDNVLKYLD